MPFAIITDSASNLNEELLEKYDIDMLTFHYLLDDKSYPCFVKEEGYKAKGKEFYNKIRNGAFIKTSLISPQDYIDCFKKYLSKGIDILYISLAAGVSGTYNSVCNARDMLIEDYPNAEIKLLDSYNASFGEGLLAILASELRKQNKDSLEPHSLKNALDTLESPSSEKTSQSKGDLKGIQSSTKFDKVATHVQDKKIMIPLLREKLQWMEEQKNGLYKEISVLGKKNVLLKGYFRDTGSSVVGILVHGYLDSAAGLGYLAKEYANLGFSVLSVDCRGHGFSGGKYITMGYTDAYDVSLWIKEIVKRKGPSVKIILHGVSMGAATVIESLGLQSTERYATYISGVIADCSFASAKKQLLKEGRRLLGKSLFARCTLRLIYWGMSFICFVTCGFFYGQSSPEKTLKKRQRLSSSMNTGWSRSPS